MEEPDGVEQLAQFPKILTALRGAEMITLQEEECNRDVLVPWVSASLGVPWAGSVAFSPGGFGESLQRLERDLARCASIAGYRPTAPLRDAGRVRRYAQRERSSFSPIPPK